MGGAFWTTGYFINTVSILGSESSVSSYVKNQAIEKDYVVVHLDKPILFEYIL